MGISSGIAALLTDIGGSFGAAAAGTAGAADLATVAATTTALGAGGGALVSGITGGDPLKGAEMGGLTGLGIGGGIGLGPAVGLGATAGGALGGAAGGALGGEATGTSPLTGALVGGASGALSGALSPAASGGGSGAGGGVGGGAAAAPASVPFSDTLSPAQSVLAPGSDVLSPAQFGAVGAAAPGASSIGILPSISGEADLLGGGGDASLLSSGSGAPVFTGVGASAPSGSAPLQGSFASGGLTAAPAIPAGTPPGMDEIAASNFAAENGANPAGNDYVSSVLNPGSGSSNLSAAPDNLAPAGSRGSGSFLSKLTSPGALISAAGLGYEALKGQQQPEYASNLESTAKSLANQGEELQSYLSSGNLPTGVQNSLTQAADAAKAAIRSRYAAMGSSGSSAEAQDLANVDQMAATQGASLATQLLQEGVNETNLSSGLYSQLMQLEMSQDTDLTNSIIGFATAAAGGVPTARGAV